MSTIEYEDLEWMYTTVQQTEPGPVYAIMSIRAYNAITDYLAEKQKKEDFWETDDFVSWGRKVYQQARQPKNAALRQFLGTNRWERRGR